MPVRPQSKSLNNFKVLKSHNILSKLNLKYFKSPKSTFWFDSEEYFSDFGSSYQSGERFCASEGMRLCTFEEYCPDGKYGATQKGFKIPFFKDAWAPFFDPDTLNQKDANKNNWLQVRDKN